ncbi:hypothetical protein [Frankia sp. Cr2]|uniref:hypothetical protein n=1 Tax=Frankia sp. Cr2 TaxID=3073932 RepID=UPI002AD405EA|nr:hypothetical protein [Frankia sp. Cr2]
MPGSYDMLPLPHEQLGRHILTRLALAGHMIAVDGSAAMLDRLRTGLRVRDHQQAALRSRQRGLSVSGETITLRATLGRHVTIARF